jgi:hypothetical protein
MKNYLLDIKKYFKKNRCLWDAVYLLNPKTPPRRVEKAGLVWGGLGCVGNGEGSTGEGGSGTAGGLDNTCSSFK